MSKDTVIIVVHKSRPEDTALRQLIADLIERGPWAFHDPEYAENFIRQAEALLDGPQLQAVQP